MFAGVDLVEGDKTGDTRVVFNITEGPVVKVSGFDIEGCTFVHPARLKTQLSESRAFLGLFGGDYNPMGADADVAKIEEYYRTFGFQDVRVSRELKWAEDQHSVRIIFHIHEGQRYRVGSVDVANNQSEDRERLRDLAGATEKIVPWLSIREVRKLLYRVDAQRFRDRVRLRWAEDPKDSNAVQWRALLAVADAWQRPLFPLSGKDVMAAGVVQGPLVGRILSEIEDWWVESDFPVDEFSIAERLKAVVQAIAY
jgi:hypothetical protein